VPAKIIFAACLVMSFVAGIFLSSKAPAAAAQFEPRQQDPTQKDMQDRMLKEANKKRQQDIRDDTDRLFELATELKAAVDKTNENLLSLEVVRKAEQVEKLAKKVKENMKEAIGPPPNIERPHRTPNPFPH
jgi:preprotein translocase subunit SecA